MEQNVMLPCMCPLCVDKISVFLSKTSYLCHFCGENVKVYSSYDFEFNNILLVTYCATKYKLPQSLTATQNRPRRGLL